MGYHLRCTGQKAKREYDGTYVSRFPKQEHRKNYHNSKVSKSSHILSYA